MAMQALHVRGTLRRPLLASAAALCLLAPLASAQFDVKAFSAEIRASEIERHVRFLASDAMQGREMGSPEVVQAAHYLAEALAGMGVAPAGDEGGYLQRVPLMRVVHKSEPRLLAIGSDGEPRELEENVDFSAFTMGVPTDSGRVRVLVVRSLEDLPEQADPGVALFFDAKVSEKRDWLAERGLDESRGWGMRLQASPNAGRAGGALPGARLVRADAQAAGPATVKLKGPLRDELLAGQLTALELSWDVEATPVPDFNVVGKIVGKGSEARPELARELVVISAHFDHIGLLPERADTPEGADRICNGADDDASGVAAVLEIAGALAAEPASERTLVILLATGEEKGLVGTWHYIEAPGAALDQTVLNLNFEMIGRPDPASGGAGKMWLTGFERSNLGPFCVERGVPLVQDPHPEQNFFARSDNIAFVRRGIVGQTFSSYCLHEDYHRPSDEADTLDYAHMETCARVGAGAVRLALSGEFQPLWNEGEPRLR